MVIAGYDICIVEKYHWYRSTVQVKNVKNIIDDNSLTKHLSNVKLMSKYS